MARSDNDKMAAEARRMRSMTEPNTIAGETDEPAKGREGKTGGSDVTAPQKNLKEEGQEMIAVRQVYREKDGDLEVTPFFVDFASARVRFSPLGRAREDEMRTSDFLNRFELVGQSRLAEKPARKDADRK